MTKLDMAILREWAEAKVSRRRFATDYDLEVARHILANLPTPTMDMADPHLAVWESGVTAHPEVVYVPHFLPLDDVELVEQIGIDLLAAAAHVRKQAKKGVGRADA